MRHLVMVAGLALAVSGCSHGNLTSASSRPLRPPAVKQALYDPYAPYGSVPARWKPPVASRDGTIVKPTDPADQADRPDYEGASWSVGSQSRRAGTF
ncbi:hypothetical protein DY926_14135 [Komagataeibacter melaceti]|uniref:Septal ring lytic transglycosylase RlpA family lipoprotein n=1 Tax=Komagataeibacter melaceti TaxID=2766577 RepID=A0A371YXC5_9PROT|nr:hypothetical protein [Komagataeibacter melaceti]RFD18892.1 hypothetical protein DY926_14135 [Komagataeibacter melaceti]